MGNEQDGTTAKKNFASLPVQLRELVLSKTDTDTRLKLFQINNELRGWVLKEELFGEDMEIFRIWDPSEVYIVPRNKSGQDLKKRRRIDLSNQYVFKVVRRCKKLFLYDGDFTLTRILPRLQSINRFQFNGMNFTKLSQMFKDNAIQVTGSCSFFFLYGERMTNNIVEMSFQFIENHLKRCKTVYFGGYPFEKLFDFLGTQHFLQTTFYYLEHERDRWERDLKMILRKGVPGLQPDSMIEMMLDCWSDELLTEDGGMSESDALNKIFNIISEGTDVVRENEAIRNKFLVTYEKLDESLDEDDSEFFGLQRKFNEKRNLIFLVCPSTSGGQIVIHIKFDPIEE